MLSTSTINYVNLIFLITTFFLFFVYLIDKFYWKNHQNDQDNIIVNIAYELLPVLLIVLIVRTYFYEPFKIPSESMLPLLDNGDFILVSKSSYSIKLPFTNFALFDVSKPKNGDVVVFEYPLDTSTYFVKRVVGIPNDHIVWDQNNMYINGIQVKRERFVIPNGVMPSYGGRFEYEYLGEKKHINRKLISDEKESFKSNYDFVMLKNNHRLDNNGEMVTHLEIKVPKDYYFVMGDNREQSMDSRSWGFVHKNYIVGEVSHIIFSIDPDVSLWNLTKKISFKKFGSIN